MYIYLVYDYGEYGPQSICAFEKIEDFQFVIGCYFSFLIEKFKKRNLEKEYIDKRITQIEDYQREVFDNFAKLTFETGRSVPLASGWGALTIIKLEIGVWS